MAGSILGRDQIARINGAYPALVAHIRALLAADHSAYGLMKVHTAVECIDTTELFNIFSKLTFISPAEKRALVRAAVYEVLTSDANAARAEGVAAIDLVFVPRDTTNAPEVLKSFTPAQFKLNVATSEAMQDKAPTPEAAPVAVKPSAIGVIESLRADAAAAHAKGEAERNAAVAKLRAAVEPAIVMYPAPAADLSIGDEVAEIETSEEE